MIMITLRPEKRTAGGALASLAAHDIVTQCGVDPQHISCYTYGCPRVGNAAWASEWKKTVPNTWHVINNKVPST